jgi:cytochrome P450
MAAVNQGFGVIPDAERLAPPMPEPDVATPSSWRLLKHYRTNALRAWPRHAYADDVLARPLFGRPSVLINAPADIRRVLVDNVANYGRTRPTIRILRPILGEGLFLADDDRWRHQRRTLAPAFAPKAVALFARHTAAALADAVLAIARDGQAPVNLLAWFQSVALDVAGRALFSVTMRDHGPRMRDLLNGYGRCFGQPSFLDFVLPTWLPSPRDLGRRRFSRRWFALVDQFVTERRGRATDGDHRDVFDLIIDSASAGDGGSPSDQDVRDQVATLIVAGHETTAVSLFWACYLLALAPAWQERLAAEVNGLDLSAAAASDALPRLVLTRAVVQEALRLYPPAFVIVRLARGPDRLAGCTVEPGSVIMIAPWVLHRHKALWRDPDAFDPSRFLPGVAAPDRYAYLPFGAGPRVCIGASLAMTEATIVLATLVQRFHIAVVDDRPVLPIAVVTTQPDHAPDFRVSPRDGAAPGASERR